MTESATETPTETTTETARDALLSAIRVCAVNAEKNPRADVTLSCAQAARELAEAYRLLVD